MTKSSLKKNTFAKQNLWRISNLPLNIKIKLNQILTNNPIIKKISSFIKFFNHKKNIINEFSKYQDYLAPGKYKFSASFKFLYNTSLNKSELSDLKILDSNSNVLWNYCESLFASILLKLYSCGKLSVKAMDVKLFNGVTFYPLFCESRNKIKFFDLTNEQVLTLYLDKHSLFYEVNSLNSMKDFYPTPRLIDCNEEKRFTIEEFIRFKTRDEMNRSDYLLVVNDIVKNNIRYYKNIDNNYETISAKEILEELTSPDYTALHDYVLNNFEGAQLTTRYPVVKQHGDLHVGNVLLNVDDNSIKYIDFEHSGDHVFFYDIFRPSLSTLYDDIAFANIRNACQSNIFSDLMINYFQIFNLTYKACNKSQYFLLVYLTYVKICGFSSDMHCLYLKRAEHFEQK